VSVTVALEEDGARTRERSGIPLAGVGKGLELERGLSYRSKCASNLGVSLLLPLCPLLKETQW